MKRTAVLRLFFAVLFLATISSPTETYRAKSVAESAGSLSGIPAPNPGIPDPPVPEPKNVELIGHIGGATQALSLKENYLYTGMGSELAVMDLAQPAHPVRVAYIVFPGLVKEIQIIDHFAYVLSGPGIYEGMSSQLHIVNIMEPAKPKLVGSYLSEEFIWDLYVAGGYAYLAEYDHGLEIVDVRNPAKPTLAGTSQQPEAAAAVMTIGSYAYVAEDLFGLRILDVSNPAQPVQLNQLPLNERFQDMVQADNFAFVVVEYGFLILETSDPRNPVVVGRGNTAGRAKRLFVEGQYAYVAQDALSIFDVSDPAHPKEIGYLDEPDKPFDVVTSGAYAYLADGGLSIIDISKPTLPDKISTYPAPTTMWGLAAEDGTVYTGDKDFFVIDVTNPADPVVAGSCAMYRYLQDVTPAGGVAFVASSGVQVIDIANPAKPALIGDTPQASPGDFQSIESVTVAGERAYAPSDWRGLWILDISVPALPQVIGRYQSHDIMGNTSDAAISGPYAYVAEDFFRVIDVSNPASPVRLASVEKPVYFSTIEVVGQIAYVAGYGGLVVFDISDPASPAELSYYPMEGHVFDLVVSGPYLFLTQESTGLHVFDVSDPVHPVQVGFFPFGGNFVDLDVSGEYVYVNDAPTGLYILRFTGSTVSGQIRQPNGLPFANTELAFGPELMAKTNEQGAYRLTGLAPGTYSLTPTLSGYSFSPPTRTASVPPDAANQSFTILPAPVSVAVTPSTAASLVLTDTQGLPARLEIPAGSVTSAATLTLTPSLAVDGAGLAFAGHAFELAASPPATFTDPLTLTLSYSAADLWAVTEESDLALLWWDGAAWQDAGQACGEAFWYGRDLERNVLTLPICRTGAYALYGSTHQLHFPLSQVRR